MTSLFAPLKHKLHQEAYETYMNLTLLIEEHIILHNLHIWRT